MADTWAGYIRDNPDRVKRPQERVHVGPHLLPDKEEAHHVELMARIAHDTHEAAQWVTTIEHGIKLGWKNKKAQRRKRVMRGLPDVMCFHQMPKNLQTFPVTDWTGLVIELKIGLNDLTTEQEALLTKLHDGGWAVCVAHGVEQAWAAWLEYTRDSTSFVSGL